MTPPDFIETVKQRKFLSNLNLNQTILLKNLVHKEILGLGTLGCVKLVVDKTTNESYALKCMRKSDINALNAVDNVLSERAILAEIDCPFITKLHATYKTKKFVFMLLSANMGGEIFQLLVKEGTLAPNSVKFYIGSLVLAFEYLHDRKIVYRDLKPENCLLDSNGYIKLCDFGFAKKVVHRTYTVCGTPEYLAPGNSITTTNLLFRF